MKFPKLEIENFLTIEKAELSLEDLGLVMIAGVSDESSADSNGAGKSSLADAVSWVIWGRTARGVWSDGVVNTAEGKNTRVAITIDDNGDMWRIERFRKHHAGKNSVLLFQKNAQGEWDSRTGGTNKLTQAKIEALLGCSEEVFNAAIYSGQEQMPDIPNMSDGVLKKLVEQAAGVDVLNRAYEVAKSKLRKASEKTAQQQIKLDRAKDRYDDGKVSYDRLCDQSKSWQSNQTLTIEEKRDLTLEAKTEFELGAKELKPNEEKSIRAKMEEIQTEIQSVSEQRDREKVLVKDLETAKVTKATLEQKITALEAILEAASNAVVQETKKLAQITNEVDTPCPSCGRPLEEIHLRNTIDHQRGFLKRKETEKTKALENLAKAEARRPAADKLVKNAESALQKHRDGMTDVSSQTEKSNELARKLDVIENTKREVERLRAAAQALAKEWKAAKLEKNPFENMLGDAEDDLIERKQEIEDAKKGLAQAREEEKYAQAQSDIYSPSGVRAVRLDEATPYLNERTSHYLGSLADGEIEAFWTTLSEKADGSLMEKFSVTVEKKGSAPSFANLSGGEKRKVRIACALALQDLVATRASKPIDLWIGDEIDDALDTAGLERLMGVLEEKARQRGTVMVISHNDIRDFARKTYTVTKKNGRATVQTT